MIIQVLCLLLRPLGWLFSLFAQHSRRPAGAPVKRLHVGVKVQRDLCFTPTDASPLLADVYVPRLPGALPAVLMIHGGGWSSGDRMQTASQARRVAARGYVVVNATYRLAPGARFPAQVEDMQQALRWMRANASDLQIDPARIAAWGYSAGAHLAAMLASLSQSDSLYADDARVAVVVAGGTPADLRKFHGGTLVPEFLGEKWHEGSPLFRQASPAALVTPKHPPIFLYHGSVDLLVPLDQTLDYRLALDAAGVPNEFYLLRGLGHIAAFLMDATAVQRGADFLDRRLRQAS